MIHQLRVLSPSTPALCPSCRPPLADSLAPNGSPRFTSPPFPLSLFLCLSVSLSLFLCLSVSFFLSILRSSSATGTIHSRPPSTCPSSFLPTNYSILLLKILSENSVSIITRANMKIFIITKIFGYYFFFLSRLLFLFIVRSKPSVDHRAQSYPCSLARTLFVSFPPIATRVSSSLPSFLPSFLCFFLPFHPRGALQTAASRSLDLCTPHAPSSTWCVPPSRRYNRIGVTYPSPPDKTTLAIRLLLLSFFVRGPSKILVEEETYSSSFFCGVRGSSIDFCFNSFGLVKVND